jgi:ubiquinone/menaquinone biosynthesis C-methylase UbiE
MAFITRRTLTPESMDDPAAGRAMLADSLRFLRRVNRWFGGVGPLLRQLDRWTAGAGGDGGAGAGAGAGARAGAGSSAGARTGDASVLRLLDVGTGAADVPIAVTEWAARRGTEVRIVAVDAHPTTLELAREAVGGRPGIELVCCDALALSDRFGPGAFDFVHASLFIHHLSDVRALTMLRIMDRLARRGVMWNDLVRGAWGRLAVRLASGAAPAWVRHDGRASVEAGFTRREAMDMASRAGWERVRYRTHWGYRFSLTSTK